MAGCEDFGGTMRVALADGDGPATALRRAQASSESGGSGWNHRRIEGLAMGGLLLLQHWGVCFSTRGHFCSRPYRWQ